MCIQLLHVERPSVGALISPVRVQAAYKRQGAAADEAAHAASSLQSCAMEQHAEMRALVSQLEAAHTAAERSQRATSAQDAVIAELRAALESRAADLGDAEKSALDEELTRAQQRVDAARQADALDRADAQLQALQRELEAKDAELQVRCALRVIACCCVRDTALALVPSSASDAALKLTCRVELDVATCAGLHLLRVCLQFEMCGVAH